MDRYHPELMPMSRYDRQMVMPEIGPAGQQRLAAAHVAVVGAGGLGCPVLSYLAGAGVGHLTLIDADRVDESNLHRQPLYTMADIGTSKVLAAAARLQAFNPDLVITAEVVRLEPANAAPVCGGADVIIDAADSFAVSYTLSDLCVQTGQALITASVLGFNGYAGGFCGGTAPSLRAVFPELPESSQDCATAGVSGPVVGMLGALQAQLALSHLLGLEPSALGRMITVDLRSFTMSSFSFSGAAEPTGGFRFISLSQIARDDLVVDLRGREEAAITVTADAHRSSVREITALSEQARGRRAVVCCRTGVRAWNAALKLQQSGCAEIALVALG